MRERFFFLSYLLDRQFPICTSMYGAQIEAQIDGRSEKKTRDTYEIGEEEEEAKNEAQNPGKSYQVSINAAS